MPLTWCSCCQTFAVDPDAGAGRLCLLCLAHRCDGQGDCEVPAETRRMVLGWDSEVRPGAPQRGCPAPRADRPFAAAADAYVVTNYDRAPYAAIAAGLGETYEQIQGRVRRLIADGRLDPATRYYRAPWSEADEDYLRARWGKVADAAVARHLGRTEIACLLKAKRLGLNRKGTMYTAHAVAVIFALDDHCIARWIRLGWLAGKRSPIYQGCHRMWSIEEADLCAFIAAHPTAYDRTRIDPEAYRYWRRLADRAAERAHVPARPTRQGAHWTEAEDRYLNDHWGQVPDQDIAAHLGRSVEACYHRAEDLSITRHTGLAGWYTTTQAAEHLAVPITRIARWLALGLLPASRCTIGSGNGLLWRISPARLAEFAHLHPELVHPERYLNASEAGRELGVSVLAITAWIAAGRLPAKRSLTSKAAGPGARWVITPEDLAAFCAAHPALLPAERQAA